MEETWIPLFGSRGNRRPALPLLVEHLPCAGAAAHDGEPTDRLVLPYERREKARQRARLESGREVGILVPRGTVLRGGDRLRSTEGLLVEVAAALERVSTVRCAERRELARLAYHLGNRHVALEVGDGWVRYLADHVLDAMVEQLGLGVLHETAPFEPEGGAYGRHEHGSSALPRGHSHSQAHSHAHSHSAAPRATVHSHSATHSKSTVRLHSPHSSPPRHAHAATPPPPAVQRQEPPQRYVLGRVRPVEPLDLDTGEEPR